MNPFELSVLFGIPALVILSLIVSSLLASQLSGYTLIAASVFMSWIAACLVVAAFAHGDYDIVYVLGKLIGAVAVIIFAVRCALLARRRKRDGSAF